MTMAMESESTPQGLHPRADAALRWIGDLDHPHYEDERNRFVWYEASAIGLQLIIMLQILVVGVVLLILGRDALPLLLIGLAPVLVGAIIVEAYARAKHAPYFIRATHMRRSRGIAAMIIAAIYIAGTLRMGLDRDANGERDLTLFLGAIAGFGGLALGMWWRGRSDDA